MYTILAHNTVLYSISPSKSIFDWNLYVTFMYTKAGVIEMHNLVSMPVTDRN